MGRRLSEPTITGKTADYIHGHLAGIHTLSLTTCGNTRGGKGGGISIEAPQINEPSINTPPPSTLALSSAFSLPTLCFLSLALNHTSGVASERRGPPAPLVWSERSHDQQASTRSRTDWLTPQAQPRQKDPEGVNSTISELFHMTGK